MCFEFEDTLQGLYSYFNFKKSKDLHLSILATNNSINWWDSENLLKLEVVI